MDSGEIKISVIIPVYGVEAYLSACVDSVLMQTHRNIEVILVDDGSPDGCPQICDAYAEADNRVRVIHQANAGLSGARNAGLACAGGDYVLFLDGDDFWDDEDALRHLADRVKLTDPDVLNFSYKKYYENTGKTIPYFQKPESMPAGTIGKARQIRFLTERGYYIASAVNKLIRRSLFDQDLLFERGVLSEDVVWCARLMEKAGSMDFADFCFYCYRQRESSITHAAGPKRAEDLCGHILTCLAMTEAAGPELKDSMRRYTAFQYGTFFMVQAQVSDVPTDCIDRLAGHTGILKYDGGNRKLKLLHFSCGLIGYRNTCRLMRRVYGNRGR